MSNFCNKCIQWEKVTPQLAGSNFGICHDVSVAMKVALDGKTHLGEDGAFWTEAYFGCVHWRENDGSLLGFDDIIDSDTGEII